MNSIEVDKLYSRMLYCASARNRYTVAEHDGVNYIGSVQRLSYTIAWIYGKECNYT